MCGYRYCHMYDDCLSGGGGDDSFIGFPMQTDEDYGLCLSHHKMFEYLFVHGRFLFSGYHVIIFTRALQSHAAETGMHHTQRLRLQVGTGILDHSSVLYVALIVGVWSWIVYGHLVQPPDRQLAPELL